jgi:hypothetical protein
MRTFLLLSLSFVSTAAFADACPNLAGSYNACTNNLQGGLSSDAQSFVVTQAGDVYTVLENDTSGNSTTVYTADGSTQTQTTNDPTLGTIVSTSQTSCVNNAVVAMSSATVNGKVLMIFTQAVSLDASNHLVMAMSASDGTNSESLGNITCTKAQ